MANAKPIKRNGIWLFSDGTPIPDQDRANADARYRDTSNSLHLLTALNCGNRDPQVSVDAERQRLGWDRDTISESASETGEREESHPDLEFQIADLEHKLDICDDSCPIAEFEAAVDQRELMLA